MSKTVKRVTRVMMIGLVAMLGAEAEAHWVVIKGKCFWHSGECVRQDEDVPPDAITNPALGELVVGGPPLPNIPPLPALLRLDILCPNGAIQQIDLSDKVNLIARTPIVQGFITNTNVIDPASPDFRDAEWEVNVSDARFLATGFCSGDRPRDVIIREMSVRMNLYLKVGEKPHSAWTAICKLSDKFNLKNYPKNFPPRGVPFDCSSEKKCHVDCP